MNKEELKSKLPKNMKLSDYKELTPIPITEEYFADDNGIYIGRYDKQQRQYVIDKQVSEAVSISSINSDDVQDEEFIEFEFFNYKNGTPNKLKAQIPSKLLSDKDGLTYLKKAGLNIVNDSLFKDFIVKTKINLNTLCRLGIENSFTKRYNGSSKYGFVEIDGQPNFKNFIGIDNPILPNPAFDKLDKNMFKKKGTLQGFIDYIEYFADGSKCKDVIKIVVASGVCGFVRQYVKGSVDKPIYCISSPSSTGKGFLGHIIQLEYGPIVDGSFLVSSNSSFAGLRAMNDRLNLIPLILDDIQDKLDSKSGIEDLKQAIYEHTNGDNTIKANSNRSISEYQYTWDNALIMFSEKADLAQVKDGASNRIIVFDTGLKRGTSKQSAELVSEKNFADLNKKQYENYGWYAEAFIQCLREYAEIADIATEFDEVKQVIAKYTKTPKEASLYTLIVYTYNLLFTFGLLPSSWEYMEADDILKFYDSERIISTDEQIYQMIVNRILDQPLNYIDASIKLDQQDYNDREANGQKVRGRICTEKIGDKLYKIAKIPVKTFNENIVDITKRNDIIVNKINPKNWLENGWLIPNSNGQATVSCTNITRKFDKTDDLRKTNETCYKLVLDEVKDEPEIAEKKQEEHKELVEETRKKFEDIISNTVKKAKLEIGLPFDIIE